MVDEIDIIGIVYKDLGGILNFSVLVTQFPNLFIASLSLSAIYLMIGLGYTITYLSLRVINFANSEVFMVTTFCSVIINNKILNTVEKNQPVLETKYLFAFFLSLIVSLIVGAIISIILEVIAFRRVRKSGNNRLTTLIAAVGASLAIKEIVRLLTDSGQRANPKIISDEIIFSLWGAPLKWDLIITPIIGLIAYLTIWYIIEKTRMGKEIRAVNSNEIESKLLGINVNRVITKSFILAGGLIGVSGFMYMNIYETTNYDVGFPIGLAGFTAAVIGGMGRIKGTLIGSLLVGFIGQFSAALIGSQWREVVIFMVLILILLLKPEGLINSKVKKS